MEYKNLPYDQLKALHREIGAHLAGMRDGEIQQLREKMAALGVSPGDLIEKKPKKTNGVKSTKTPIIRRTRTPVRDRSRSGSRMRSKPASSLRNSPSSAT